MRGLSRFALLVVGVWLTVATPLRAAETQIAVTLWDKGADSVMMDEAHMKTMGKMIAAMPMAMMGIQIDKATVPAGQVTFNVTNASSVLIHEMVISPLKPDQTELPFDADGNKVDEDAAMDLGEVSELDAGKTGALTLDLGPGRYVLYCNIPGHFIGGMWVVLTVTP